MHPAEIDKALAGMVVLVDTREKPTSRLEARLRDIGAFVDRVALPFGDYSAKFPLPGGDWFSLAERCCIERKMSLTELAGCFTHERARFAREFERARSAGARLYLLVEDASWESAYAWRYRSKMASSAMIASMAAWMARYQSPLLMCKAETSGKLIREILHREGKEALLKMACEGGEEENAERMDQAAQEDTGLASLQGR